MSFLNSDLWPNLLKTALFRPLLNYVTLSEQTKFDVFLLTKSNEYEKL